MTLFPVGGGSLSEIERHPFGLLTVQSLVSSSRCASRCSGSPTNAVY